MGLAVKIAKISGAKLAGKLDNVDTKLTLAELLEDIPAYAKKERQKMLESLEKSKKKKK